MLGTLAHALLRAASTLVSRLGAEVVIAVGELSDFAVPKPIGFLGEVTQEIG